MSSAAFFSAIERRDAEEVRRLLAKRPELVRARAERDDPAARPPGSTGLHRAIDAGSLELAELLLDAGSDLEARSEEGRTALHDSIEFGHRRITELLIERGAVVDVCAAAILGRRDRLRELLGGDPELANDDSTGLSPLGWAAFGNQVETDRELLERGARMDDSELLCAASVGHVAVGKLLLERGAEISALDPKSGASALHAAVAMRYSHDSRPFVEMLLERGADVAVRARDGRTALQIAEELAARQADELSGQRESHAKPFAEIAALLRERAV